MCKIDRERARELRLEADAVWEQAVRYERSDPRLAERLKKRSSDLHYEASRLERGE
jgi:hypothetical protein